ncbi:ARM repeat-containing protein [Rhizopogon vinicolor AM-OR11-026]|uniref:ARM repeat-containing protein n=1 Tax=Rhizopogon vinicolor AM-OR11-026 TaxID=1314800 RepID=A0A1B7N5D5_9AGAM|nr:ARM repeat-containing protein [Rhizopogon vinicolor AM-OR11-026]
MNARHGDVSLDNLLGKARDPATFLPDELSYLISAFVPSHPEISRSKAYLVLSAFCQGIRSQNPQESGSNNSATESLAKVFQPLIISHISNHQQQDTIVVGLSFFSALFQVDWQSASHIFGQDGVVEYLSDALDLFPSASVALEVTRLIGQASGHKSCRALIPEEIITWLGTKSRHAMDKDLRAAAAIALVKLSRGAATDASEGTDPPQAASSASNDMELASMLKRMVISDTDSVSLLNDVVEGLAYLSVDADVKQALANDPKFLQQLFALVPRRKALATSATNSSLLFGILIIISNLCAYRPRLSQEDAQISKLKSMAKASNGSNKTAAEGPPNILEDDATVKSRCRQVLASGALDVLSVASGIESQGIKLALGKIYLSIVEDKDNRGKVLQSGGARSLSRVIQSSSSSTSSSTPIDASFLIAIQALAKLTITSSPLQVFGPADGAMLDAIRPLSQLLLHSSSNLLQQFEALMALTNLASHTTGCADRIASTSDLLNKVELLMLEDHTLIRRAATELICNLLGGSEKVFSRYGGSPDVHAAKSKLQVLLAMSDVDDLPTRLAASGALAMVTGSSTACRAVFELQLDRHRAFLVIARLIDPSVILEDDPDDDEGAGDPGLVHRGVVCFCNILNPQNALPRALLAEEVMKAGLVNVIARLLKGELGSFETAVTTPAAEILKHLIELGKLANS